MSLRLLHRRLAVCMGLAGLVAFAGGAGFEPVSAILAGAALLAAIWWQPSPRLSTRLERVWLPLATLLVARSLFHVFVVRDDVVVPVVDLLLLLLAAEALRSLEAPNDLRLYALSFALILAATAYRPGVLFLLAFVAYIVLATLALMVGHVRRKAERYGVRDVPLGRGILATTGVLSIVILAISLLVFVTFPRVSQGWAGRGETLATSIAGFGDEVSIGEHGSTILGNPEIVLRIEFPNGRPADIGNLHWRGRSYDRFDGVRWSRSTGLPPSSAPMTWYRDRWSQDLVEQRIYGSPLDVRVLFTLHPAVQVHSESGIHPLPDNAGDLHYWGSGVPVYTAVSPSEPPPAEALRAVGRGFTPSDRYFLQLPELDPRIKALADSLTAGLDNSYDKAVAIQRYLRTFQYTRQLPATAADATLAHFLFDRRAGHCEYFSTAMVVLLRSVGVHARNVNGFLGGEWSQFGDYLVVTQNEAHSWVEVWFQGYGWVTFDPTPPGAGEAALVDSWFWPGRIFFDGLQHRWTKWVLDYSLEDQSGVFARFFQRQLGQTGGESSSSEDGHRSYWGFAVLALLLLAGVDWARRGGGVKRRSPSTRMYLQLRASAARAGLGVLPGTTPFVLVDRVRSERSAAGRAVERVVDLYLRARYGREDLGESELREMREALGAARRLLRART